jgi:threonine/homoserine/homoserine lactone efflux protein
MASDFGAYLGISFIVIATPGPDTALVIKNGLLDGRRGGFFTSAGVVAGQATWTLATSAGLAALLVASEPAFLAIKLVGAAYLVFLGAQALLHAFRPSRSIRSDLTRERTPPAPSTAFRQGLISNLSNPKVAVFFTSLLPQFMPAGHAPFVALLGLGLVFCTMTLVWLTGYSIAVASAGDFLRRSGIRRALEGVMGAVLVALGLRLASEHR